MNATEASQSPIKDGSATMANSNPRQYLIESHRFEFTALVLGGSLLSFNAGFLNVVSLLISGIFVSHTSGNISKSSISLADGHVLKFLDIAIMVPCFILGSFLTTLLICSNHFHLTKVYYKVFVVATIILAIAALVDIETVGSQLYAYLAAVACGMQNALTTQYSGR